MKRFHAIAKRTESGAELLLLATPKGLAQDAHAGLMQVLQAVITQTPAAAPACACSCCEGNAAVLAELKASRALLERLVVGRELTYGAAQRFSADEINQAWLRAAMAAPLFPSEAQQAERAASRCAEAPAAAACASATARTAHRGIEGCAE